ncbi:MAG: tetratricopeptide repeat protein [Bacteroidota bacterium]
MNRSQLILSLLGIVLIVLLFQLPTVVVENDQLQEVAPTETHSLEIPAAVLQEISGLSAQITSEEDFEKKINFAHYLANRYLDYGVLDSAISVAEKIENWAEGPSENAMSIYFKAFERSQNQEQTKEYAQKARTLLKQLMEKDPSNLSLKNKLAMTLVVSENPMAGISMLREILEVNENDRQAILNLGLLAIQSGQFDRAKERFKKLVSLDTTDHEAKLYLAVSMIEINQQSQAKPLLEEILNTKDSIPAIKMMATDYLKGM